MAYETPRPSLWSKNIDKRTESVYERINPNNSGNSKLGNLKRCNSVELLSDQNESWVNAQVLRVGDKCQQCDAITTICFFVRQRSFRFDYNRATYELLVLNDHILYHLSITHTYCIFAFKSVCHSYSIHKWLMLRHIKKQIVSNVTKHVLFIFFYWSIKECILSAKRLIE